MISGFYKSKADNRNKVKGYRYLRTFLLTAIMLISMSAIGQPVFTNGSPQSTTVCPNGATDISALIAIDDPNVGNTETYNVISVSGGVISGLPTVLISTGGIIAPTGVTYTPNPGTTFDVVIISVYDNIGDTVSNTIFVTVNSPITVSLLNPNPSACAGDTTANIAFSNLLNVGPDTVRFTTVGSITWFVPAGISSLNFDVQGARGGRDNVTTSPNPGYGARVQGTLAVTTGEQLNLFVGGKGDDGASSGATGGFNGGGDAFFYSYGCGGAGGGASDIRVTGSSFTDRVVVAGGGGGNGWDLPGPLFGGAGGDNTGGNSAPNAVGSVGGGGTQTAGGAGATYTVWMPGMDGSLGTGGNGSLQGISGGGGGGYYGGGGGVWTGGGGGSSYSDIGSTSGVSVIPGYDSSNGKIIISYLIPGTYSIVWSTAAHTAGFRDTTEALPDSAFAFVVPGTAPSAVYTGTLTVNSASCSSQGYPISITVNPIPDVFPVSNQSVCNGDSTTDINFSGSVPTATFNWFNNNTGINLPANGTGHIAAFQPANITALPSVATITVTPTAAGCTGASTIFTITDKPIPVLNSTLTPPAICDSTLLNYMPGSATDSVVFTWSRAAQTGISNPAATGTDSTNEILVDTANVTESVVYQYVLNYKGCLDTQNVTATVYPHPVLSSALALPAVCNNMPFDYTQTANVTGTNITWSRAAVTGISNAASNGIDSISETLTDTTTAPVMVVYVDTLNFNSCIYTQNVTLTVNPTPVLINIMPGSQCDSTMFTYIPASATGGAAFAWSRGLTVGISNAAASDTGAINEILLDTTVAPVVVTYTYTLTASGCVNSQNITDTVRPRPRLNSTLTPDSICSNTIFTYTASSSTLGTTFAWDRDTIAGISNSPDSANVNSITELLINTTPNIIPVIYIYTLTAAGCSYTQDVIVKVDPTPVLNNNPSVATVCNKTLFSYNPGSATAGASYTWTRPYVPGVDNFGTGGTNSINDTLDNTTYVNVNVVYHYIITANGCTNTEDVTLTVHPTPMLSSDTTATICSGGSLTYYPNSYTPTTTYAWSRPVVSGITPATSSGTNVISDTLTSSSSTLVDVVYVYTLTAYGCTNTQDVTVTVNPAPLTSQITTYPSNAACDNTMYQNFGTSVTPGTGLSYTWTADNAAIWAIGTGGQYCLVNFTSPGTTATVYLMVENTATGCTSNNGYKVNVSTVGNTSPNVIYVNGQFICQTTDVDNYQWGYDDASTLDSTIIPGETNQNYFATLDATKYYWVITNHGGCLQKSYYIVPASSVGVVNVNEDQKGIKIYPNPAAENINVDIQTAAQGKFRIEVLNMLGQSVNSIMTMGHSAQIDVAGLPAGCYVVDCYIEGEKIASAKFIKN